MSKRKSIPDVMGALQGLNAPPPVEIDEVEERAVLTPPARREAVTSSSSQKKNRTSQKRLEGRATYDIGVELKKAIYRESVELGVPASQLAKYLLLYAWNYYANGDLPQPVLEKSDSPKFRNRIEF